jgi:hypothetical protein
MCWAESLAFRTKNGDRGMAIARNNRYFREVDLEGRISGYWKPLAVHQIFLQAAQKSVDFFLAYSLLAQMYV